MRAKEYKEKVQKGKAEKGIKEESKGNKIRTLK